MTQLLSSLDIATGTMLGCERVVAPLPSENGTPRAAFEQAVLPALLRPPCLVSFSGGRDSSAVLAVAANLARREGLDLPIPATNVFPGDPRADETEWQLSVLAHLGLDDWIRCEHHDELDVVGPYAQRVMRRHGLLLPFNVHMHLPLFDAAVGGSLLTGVGGDELFAAAQARGSIVGSPLRALPRNLATAAVRTTPAAARRALHRRRHPVSLPWLRDAACRLLTARVADIAVREPRVFGPRLAWWRGLRYLNEGSQGLEVLANDGDVLLAHPFLAPSVWAAVARAAAPRGFVNRTHGMASMFADVLPEPSLSRRTKAYFDAALWTDAARRFARDWDGSGVPPEYVDVEALHDHWMGDAPVASSFTLLQSAWIAQLAERLEESVDGVLV